MIIGITGAVTGRVDRVRPHPRGKFIWLADVDLGGDNDPVQIVFGGALKLTGGELVAVAPPGSRAVVHHSDASRRVKKMRIRRYRGERSYGMLCSLDELGWIRGGPDEVAILCDVKPGQSLDGLHPDSRAEFVKEWERAKRMARLKRWAVIQLVPPPASSSILRHLDLVVECC